MKKTVGRGILFYILILVGVIGGVGCVLAAIMIFSPGTEILGFSYYVNHASYEIKEMDNQTVHNLIVSGQVENIDINTSYTSVRIVTSHDFNRAEFVVQSKITGLIKAENKVKNVVLYGYDNSTRTITIETRFPEMVIPFDTSSEVILVLPVGTHIGFNFNVNTDNGEVNLGTGEEDDYILNTVNIVSSKGSNIKMGSKARFNGNLNINSPSQSITILSKLGGKLGGKDLNINELNITSKSAKIISQDLEVPTVNLRTESSSVKLGDVDGNIKYDARKGVLQVGKVTGDFNCSETVIISNITIGSVYGVVLLPAAESSNISIDHLYGIATIRTTTGNVTVKHGYSLADITTESGNISFDAYTKSELITADLNTEKGVICLNTKNGKINVNFYDVKFQNYINTESGSVTCNFIKTLDFKLKYECGKYSPSLSSGISSSDPGKSGKIAVGDGSTVNVLNVKNNSGRTNISDTLKVGEDD